MTLTEIRPREEDVPEPPMPPPARPTPSGDRWWLGAAVGVAIVALAIAMVALIVSAGNSGGSKPAAASPGTGPAATQAPVTATPPAADASAQIAVTLSEYKVGLHSTTLTAGSKTLTITNGGTMQHELLVFHPDASIDPAHLPLGSDGDINEDAPGVNKISDGDNIDPGQSQTRTVDLSQPGTYVFVCNLPGHYQMGMATIVTVVAGGASS